MKLPDYAKVSRANRTTEKIIAELQDGGSECS
jgi:hypothetical protein